MSRKVMLVMAMIAATIAMVLALPVGAQDGTPMVEVADQLVLDGTVTIAQVFSSGPGFIVIHADSGTGSPGPVIGWQSIPDGASENVHVHIDAAAATPTLFAMLHADTGEVGVYEFGTVEGADGPVRVDDAVITPPFAVNVINANDQFLENGALRIASVTAAQRGWLVVHSDAEGRPGPVLGQTLVNAGTTANVLVYLNGDVTDVLWPMLHVDTGVEGEYEFGTVEGADGPVRVGESVAVLPVWTVPHIRVADQDVSSMMMGAPTLVAKSVLSEGPGWLVVHSEAEGGPGPVLGFAPLEAGLNTDVAVELDADGLTDYVWPMLHVDTGVAGEYEFGTVQGADGPVRVGDQVVMVQVSATGSADMMMGMEESDSAGEDSMGAMLDGNELVNMRCTVCHTRERIDNASKDRAGWEATVDRMIGYGARLDADERAAVLEYLASN